MADSEKKPELTLPALRHLGELADVKPTIIIDTREQNPLPFGRLATRRGMLMSGDYSVAGLEELISVERKTVADLVACCIGQNRDRFARELHRLRGFRFKRLLVVGSEEDILRSKYQANIKPRAVLATLNAFEIRYDIPFVMCQTPEAAGRLVERWGFWFSREWVRATNNLWRAEQGKDGGHE